MSGDVSPLAATLAVAFAHGPLAGVAPALVAERERPVFTVRAIWGLLGGGVTLEAQGATLDTCHEALAGLALRLWPDLEEATGWV